MKKLYIVAFVMIAAAIVMLISAADDMSTYSSFKEARETGNKVKIAGQLAKDKQMILDPPITFICIGAL